MSVIDVLKKPVFYKIVKYLLDKYNAKLSLKQISKGTNIDENTLNQRIIRANKIYKIFDITDERPKRINLKVGIDEIVLYGDGLRCRRCKDEYSIDELTVQNRYAGAKDPNPDYIQLMTVCKNCLKHPPPSSMAIEINDLQFEAHESSRGKYLQLKIRPTYYYEPLELHPKYSFYKFWEVRNINVEGWCHLIKNVGGKEEIASLSIQSILNYFDKNGWEIYKMITPDEKQVGDEYSGDHTGDDDYDVLFQRKDPRIG